MTTDELDDWTERFDDDEWAERVKKFGSERAAMCPLVYSPSEWQERERRKREFARELRRALWGRG